MTAPIVAIDFAAGATPPRGASLVSAAREAGGTWVVLDVGADLGGVGATVRAAAASGTGVLLRLRDTRALDGLAEACAAFGEPSIEALRDRLLVVVGNDVAGRRLRDEAAWAPSALDLGCPPRAAVRWFRRTFPHLARGRAACDDVVVGAALYDAPAIGARLVPALRRRGGRVWVDAVRREDLPALAAAGVHGVVVRA